MTKIKTLTALLTLALSCSAANAASITLDYLGDSPTADGVITAPVGTLLTFNVIADFSDQPALMGGFDIAFTSDALQFDSFTSNDIGDPAFYRDPEIFDGLLEGWIIGSFDNISGVNILGTVSFVVLDAALATPGTIATQATNGVGGPFICDFVICFGEIDVDFNSYSVSAVPVPAALWLMLSGLAAFAGIRVRRN